MPVISLSLTKGSYIEGSSVNITCTATGKPDAEVSWIRNGQMKSSGRKIAYLNFDQIKRTDDGLYTCTANNSAGTISHKVIVVVRCESQIIHYQIFNLIYFERRHTFVHCILLENGYKQSKLERGFPSINRFFDSV